MHVEPRRDYVVLSCLLCLLPSSLFSHPGHCRYSLPVRLSCVPILVTVVDFTLHVLFNLTGMSCDHWGKKPAERLGKDSYPIKNYGSALSFGILLICEPCAIG